MVTEAQTVNSETARQGNRDRERDIDRDRDRQRQRQTETKRVMGGD